MAGKSALISGVVFLITIAYTFGFLFSMGLSTDMLNEPNHLMPWVHDHTVAFVGLWWIFVVHLLFLLPVPADKVRTLRVLVTVARPDLAGSHALTFTLADGKEARAAEAVFVPGARK